MRTSPVVTLVVAVLLLGTNAAFAAPWVRVRSPHFIVSANTGEMLAKDVDSRLEQFRAILAGLFPKARLATRPLFVVVFDNDAAFTPFKPLHKGKPERVVGYFSGNPDGGCVAFRLDGGEQSFMIAFHEYAHLFFAEATRGLPVWLKEGLAEYYSTVRFADGDHRIVRVGQPHKEHLEQLQSRFMPLATLFTAASRIWDNHGEAVLYYAESWALVHYLATQTPPGTLAELMRQLAAGRTDEAAFEAAIGPLADVEAGFRRYIAKGEYPAQSYELPGSVATNRAAARVMSMAEVEATVAIPLIYLKRFKDAGAHVAMALKEDPLLAEAHVARGLLELIQGHAVEAARRLRGAVHNAPGHLDAAYFWGVSLAGMDDPDLDDMVSARDALVAAIPPDDEPADALTVLGLLQSRTGQLDKGETTLRRASSLAPGRTQTSLFLAGILIQKGDYTEAQGILEPIAARPTTEQEREWAKKLLGRIPK